MTPHDIFRLEPRETRRLILLMVDGSQRRDTITYSGHEGGFFWFINSEGTQVSHRAEDIKSIFIFPYQTDDAKFTAPKSIAR